MKRLIVIALTSSFGSLLAAGDTTEAYTDFNKKSALSYTLELRSPFQNVLQVEDGSLKSRWNIAKTKFQKPLKNPNEQANKEEALRLGKLLKDKLIGGDLAKDQLPCPYELLDVKPEIQHDVAHDLLAADKAVKLYEEQPSSLASLVYLETAIIYFNDQKFDEASALLEEANTKLKIEDLTFLKDSVFRELITKDLVFGRPEAAILYMRILLAERNEKPLEVARLLNILISQMPSDPYAWQAFIEFGHKGDKEAELMNHLTATYPIVFGHIQEGLKDVDKQTFVGMLPAYLAETRLINKF